MKPGTAMLALVLVLAACGDDASGPAYAAFEGEWRGSVSGITVRIDELADDDGDLNGRGRFQMAAQTVNFSLTGEHRHPDVDFEASPDNFASFTFEGEFVAQDTVRGRANGSGFTNDPLILIRQ